MKEPIIENTEGGMNQGETKEAKTRNNSSESLTTETTPRANRNSSDKGTQPTLVDTTAALNIIYEELEVINFKLRMHPNRDQLLKRIEEGDIDSKTKSAGKSQNNKSASEQEDGNSSGKLANLNALLEVIKVTERDYKVISTLEILEIADSIGFPLGARNGNIYVYTGKYWDIYNPDDFTQFLQKCYLRTGVPMTMARDAAFLKRAMDQFMKSAHIKEPPSDEIAINFQNVTLEFDREGNHTIRDHNPEDFITYVLPYDFDEKADCPLFQEYLDYVVREKDKQLVLAEFIGSVFSDLKHEKVLMLYGSGKNGKSVFYDVITGALGPENICSNTLEALTDSKLYFIGELSKCLLNFSGEISTKVNPDMFKKLASRETVTARYPYGQPFEVENYARLAFNCNVLPEAKETTEGFFRRFLIIPFEVQIPKKKRDPRLAEKIVDTELPGIMNWILDGLKRLEKKEDFSPCESAERVLKEYRYESDTVGLFLEEMPFNSEWKSSDLYSLYDGFCSENDHSKLGIKQFAQQLEEKGVRKNRKSGGSYYDVHNFTL